MGERLKLNRSSRGNAIKFENGFIERRTDKNRQLFLQELC